MKFYALCAYTGNFVADSYVYFTALVCVCNTKRVCLYVRIWFISFYIVTLDYLYDVEVTHVHTFIQHTYAFSLTSNSELHVWRASRYMLTVLAYCCKFSDLRSVL